jgi:hypothetical protein
MTLDEAEEFLFFVRDSMLLNREYNSELVWKMPDMALNDPKLAKLVYRWYYTTKSDTRKYLEGRIISYVASINQ